MHCLRELYGHEMLIRGHKRTARPDNLPFYSVGRYIGELFFSFLISQHLTSLDVLEFHVYRVLLLNKSPIQEETFNVNSVNCRCAMR